MDAPAARAMLDRMGFTNAAATEMVADTGQDLSSIDDYLTMDEEVINSICGYYVSQEVATTGRLCQRPKPISGRWCIT